MPRHFGRKRRLIVLLFLTWCLPAMSMQTSPIQPPTETTAVPLRFKLHNFEALCYNAIGCTVFYNGRYQETNGPTDVSPPPSGQDYKNSWGSVELGIRNFPPPAVVKWKSMDGIHHEAMIDIGKIFKNELIWHRLTKDQMTDFYRGPVAGAPDIYLEVNNHVINVYMAMFIPTKTEQIPGNKDSNFRKDIFLTWSQSY
jgi:hypothetical protein